MNSLPKMLFLSGAAAILIALTLSQVHIPLSKAESDAIFDSCVECKSPPTYRNVDPNLDYSLLAAGIATLMAGGISATFLHKAQSENTPETMK